MEEKIVYFEKAGPENTAAVIEIVKSQAALSGIKKVVVASTRGDTARRFAEAFQGTGIQLVVIPWQYGFAELYVEGSQPFPEELADRLRRGGHQVHFGTMLFHSENLYGSKVPGALAGVLRAFGQGIKVCVEILMMACDGGCVIKGEKVIAVAGTRSGADTAVLATAAPSLLLSDLRIHKILCKPENWD
ncbi:MAG: hypothetical protein ACE141_10330 [Bryobacteraceae bacterium]